MIYISDAYYPFQASIICPDTGHRGVFMEKETTALSDEERLSAKVDELLTSISALSNQDAEEIEKLKAIIKKKVPFFKRSTFTAILLKLACERRSSFPAKEERRRQPKPVRKENAENAASAPSEEPKAERVLPADAKTLYLNVGKMKHLYGKDLSKLLQSELGITRDDIYSLRVHDKYSFITMSEENCNKAIEKLNGKDINGRVAQLSFSNK